MENRRVARFFIETLIGEQVTEIAVVPQEYVYKRAIRKEKADTEKKDTGNPAFGFFSIIRYDFVATTLYRRRRV